MMVHPSQQTAPHREYFHWVSQIKQSWQEILGLPSSDPDRQELADSFLIAWRDLSDTVDGLPSFEAIERVLLRAISQTLLVEVNARGGRTPEIPWRRAYSFVLVGGQAMDRGFTVEGLTVTYMPRSLGVGNADTVQQRARFLGYKGSYVGYCRVFLESDVAAAYRRYVRHEEHVHKQLEALDAAGKPLTEWRRAFFLDSELRPTRAEVMDLGYVQDTFSDRWFESKSPHDSLAAVADNRSTVEDFVRVLTLVNDVGHADRTPIQRHMVARDVPMLKVYEELLVPFKMTAQVDQSKYLGLQLQVKAHLDRNADATCELYVMSQGAERERVSHDGEIAQLFQGANYAGQVTVYPGDREIKQRDQLTIQIHKLRVTQEGTGDLTNIPALAIWVPQSMAEDWIVQDGNDHS
jgi:hypothetical protein